MYTGCIIFSWIKGMLISVMIDYSCIAIKQFYFSVFHSHSHLKLNILTLYFYMYKFPTILENLTVHAVL